MKSLGFDPGAHARLGGAEELCEITLERCDDGRLLLTGEADDGAQFSLLLRPDFLDEVIAQARAGEKNAA